MENNIYIKLSKIRESIKKEPEAECFSELLTLINKKTKRYGIIPLYCFYNDVATLTLVDMDNIAMCLKFQIPVELVGARHVKEQLYRMAFDLEEYKETVTPEQYASLLERMEKKGVTAKEIEERHKLEKLTDITVEIYKRCMSALSRMT